MTVFPLLLLASISAAVPSTSPRPVNFEALVASFPELSLPAAKLEAKTALDKEAVWTFLIAPARALYAKPGHKSLEPLAKLGAPDKKAAFVKPSSGEMPAPDGLEIVVKALGRVEAKGYRALLFEVSEQWMMGGAQTTCLFTFDAAGAPIDAMVLAYDMGTEAGGTSTTFSIDKDFKVTAAVTGFVPVYDVEGLSQLDMPSTGSFAVSPAGAVSEGPQVRTSWAGRYDDPKSKEILYVTGEGEKLRVFYKSKPEAKSKTLELARAEAAKRQAVVRFPGSPKEYVVTAAADLKSVSCKNPDGTVQTFKRTW